MYAMNLFPLIKSLTVFLHFRYAAPLSPQESVIYGLISISAWPIFTWSLCSIYLGDRATSFPRICLSVAVETAIVAAVAIPGYHWGEEEWNVVMDHLNLW